MIAIPLVILSAKLMAPYMKPPLAELGPIKSACIDIEVTSKTVPDAPSKIDTK